ncbi:MAG: hypothetical protein LUI85_18220 [Bacteroides sp.]|nr:hypothetical protein [Bacteroides sp.]
MEKRTIISVMVIVDVVKALGNRTLKGCVYMYDNNRLNGSTGEGTEELSPLLLLPDADEDISNIGMAWNIMPLDPEAFAELACVEVDAEYMDVNREVYAGSDVAYWTGWVKKPFEELSCKLYIRLGNSKKALQHNFKIRGKNIEKK